MLNEVECYSDFSLRAEVVRSIVSCLVIRRRMVTLRGNHALMWYKRCIVGLIDVITHMSCGIIRASGNYLATCLLVGVRRGDGSAVFLAVALLFGVLGAVDFPRWPLLFLSLVACRFLTGLAAVFDLLVVELLPFSAAGFGVLEFEESVRFGACVAFLLILFLEGDFLTGVVDGVAC